MGFTYLGYFLSIFFLFQVLFPHSYNPKMSLNVSIASNVDQKPKRQTQQQKDKGQLISKCPFDVIVSTKIPTIF